MEEEVNKIIGAIESDVTPPSRSRRYVLDGEPSVSVVTGIDTLVGIEKDIELIEPDADVRQYHQRAKRRQSLREYERKREHIRRERERAMLLAQIQAQRVDKKEA